MELNYTITCRSKGSDDMHVSIHCYFLFAHYGGKSTAVGRIKTHLLAAFHTSCVLPATNNPLIAALG